MPEADTYMAIREARRLLDSGEASSEELTRAHLARMAELDPAIHAITTANEESALKTAGELSAAT